MVDPGHKCHDLPLAGLPIGPGTPQELIVARVAPPLQEKRRPRELRLPHLGPRELHLHHALGLAWVLKVFIVLAWLAQLTHLDHKCDGWDQTTDRSEAGDRWGPRALDENRTWDGLT